jgi:hypothetical protein
VIPDRDWREVPSEPRPPPRRDRRGGLGQGQPPPSDPGEPTFLLLSTRTPAVAEFTGPDGGKTAHCMVRWLSSDARRDGEAGPWSDTVSATIGA